MKRETIYSAILGAVVADALGVPYEFKYRQDMIENPATTMTGYGTYNQPLGSWSDDSSMTLATMDSLTGGVDYDDMISKFCEWIFDDKYTPSGYVFDYGSTTHKALVNYRYDRMNPLECGLDGLRDNGNGSLMRIIPASLYAFASKYSVEEQMIFIDNVSSLTHAHPISKASCNIYNFIVQEVLNHPDEDFKTLITRGIDKSRRYYENEDFDCFDVLYNNLFTSDDEEISGRGYVVDSLEVALYCSYHTSSYKQAVLKAVNYGGDTDTNAIITGALSGLYYSFESIPRDWLNSVLKLDEIKRLCDEFHDSL